MSGTEFISALTTGAVIADGSIDGADLSADAFTTIAASTALTGSYANSVKAYGAKGDAGQVSDGSITAGTAILTRSGGAAFGGSVAAGMKVIMQGAGGSGVDLTTMIQTVSPDRKTVTLTTQAGTTIASSAVTIGTDDTAAIDAARSASASVWFPAGGYIYDGIGLDAAGLTAEGAGRGLVTVFLGSGKSFIVRPAGGVSRLTVRGMRFVGGYGAVRLAATGISVQNPLVIEECEFQNYRGAAVSSLLTDQPYWQIRNNTFFGYDDTTTFGVSLNGDNAQSVIDSNAFLFNGCHVRLGGTGGGACRVSNNDFIRFGSYTTTPRIDLWIVGATPGSSVGLGLTVTNNKFGNEGSDYRDYRVLVANEDPATGYDAATRRPGVANESGTTLNGVTFDNNLVAGQGGVTAAFLTSATGDIRACSISNLTLAGNVGSNIVKYLFPPLDSVQTSANVLGPILSADMMLNGDWSSFRPVSHQGFWTIPPGGVTEVLDPDGPAPFPGGSDFVGYAALSTGPISSYLNVSTASKVSAADAMGGTDAATLTFAASGDAVYTSIANGSIVPGYPIYVEFDVKSGGPSPLAGVRVSLQFGGSSRWERAVPVTSAWRRVRIRLTPRAGTQINQFKFAPMPDVAGTVLVGRPRVYHAREPLNVDGYIMVNGAPSPAAAFGPLSKSVTRTDFAGTFGDLDAQAYPSPTSDVPTITVSGPGGSNPVSGQSFAYSSGYITAVGAYDIAFSQFSVTYLQNISNGQTGSGADVHGRQFSTDSADIGFSFRCASNSTRLRVEVDGRPVGRGWYTPSGNVSPGSQSFLRLTFPTTKMRNIRIWSCQADFGGVNILSSASMVVTQKRETVRCVFLGDSWFGGSDDGGWPNRPQDHLAALLGWEPFHAGIGGTGYLKSSTPFGATGGVNRLAPIVAIAPHYVVISGSINDDDQTASAVQTAAANLYSYFATNLPNTQLIVIGPQPVPTVPNAAHLANVAAVRAAAQAASNVLLFIDPTTEQWFTGSGKITAPSGDGGNADYFLGATGLHPTQLGSRYYARRIAEKIITKFAAVSRPWETWPGPVITPPTQALLDTLDATSTATLVAEFDASLITATDGAALASWSPRRGLQSAAFVQATPANQPTYQATGLNGKPCVRFTNSAASSMDTGTWATAYGQPLTVFFVHNDGASVAGTIDMLSGNSGGTASVRIALFGSGTGDKHGIAVDSNGLAATTPSLSRSTTPHVVAAVFNGNGASFFWGNTKTKSSGVAVGGVASQSGTGLSGLRLVAGPNFDASHVLVYSGIMSDADINRTLDYLASKWAVTLS